jgi:gamma-glutamylcyclotransferase (GGCT)/AIG2-like uncharacterized protein YtfP
VTPPIAAMPARDREPAVVAALVDAANAGRRGARGDAATLPQARDAERRLETLFGCSERLAVYGSLAPGRENHHIVAPLGGSWSEGVVEGEMTRYGWGAAMGYSALHLRPGGPAVAVHVLTSVALPAAWPELDAFEGAEYRRVLVPVWSNGDGGRTLVTVANLYEGSGGG